MAKNNRASSNTIQLKDLTPALCALGFFSAVCLASVNTAKVTALLCVALALVVGLFCFTRLRERFHLPMLMLALFTAMGGVSTFYAVSGKFALREFLKLLISFCLAVAFLSLVKGEGSKPARKIASTLAWGAAISGVISIDLLSTHIISGLFSVISGIFSSDYADMGGVEAGVRMTSMFQNPNVFAACVGIGVMLGLGLVLSAETEKERRNSLICLYINALSFVLAFSMGAIAFAALGFLSYLLLERKERRAELFVLMVETLLVTLVGMIPIAVTSLDTWNGFQPIPLICLALGAAALCLLDRHVGQKLAAGLKEHSRALLAIIVAVLVGIVAFALLAYNLTGSATLNGGESLRRSAYPAAGTYTLEVQGSGEVTVSITTQNRQETMMHTKTALYSGAAQGAVFTVPEDSMVVWFTFHTADGAVLDAVTCQGDSAVSVPLNYKLLPTFISNRLQGLFANQNAIQRTVFFEDGMKIFARSPIVGLGLGSYENGIMSVQSFYYETKYAHNHYIQTLAETGVIGLVLFLGLLGTSAAAILLDRRKKEACHTMTPALGATLIFMAGHAVMEVDFSFYSYLPFAFGVFALISLCCGDALPRPKVSETLRTVALGAVAALTVVFSVFLILNLTAADLVDKSPTFDNLERAAKMDAFEHNDYMLSYVYSSDSSENLHVQTQAKEFAEKLAKVDSNSIPIYLAQYYFNLGNTEQGFAMIRKYVGYVSSDATAWDQAFSILAAFDDGSEEYRAEATAIAQELQLWMDGHMGTISLNETSKLYLSLLGVAVQ